MKSQKTNDKNIGGMAVGGSKMQGKPLAKSGYEPSAKGTQKRRAIPADTAKDGKAGGAKPTKAASVPNSGIINQTELEQLRSKQSLSCAYKFDCL